MTLQTDTVPLGKEREIPQEIRVYELIWSRSETMHGRDLRFILGKLNASQVV